MPATVLVSPRLPTNQATSPPTTPPHHPPPILQQGYVGYDEGGQLTEAVRRKPYSVVLFDEVEKAHVDVFNLLLQILDDGRVTDSQGRVVSFKNAIIILTSNLGSAEVFNFAYKRRARGAGEAAAAAEGDMEGALFWCWCWCCVQLLFSCIYVCSVSTRRPARAQRTNSSSNTQTTHQSNNQHTNTNQNNTTNHSTTNTYEQPNQHQTQTPEMRELVMERVRKHFQPEFINRIDEFIIFEPLAAEQIEAIVRLQVRGVAARLGEKKMKLRLADSAARHLAAVGFDPVYGARPVKRAVQRELETPLAKALLTGQFQEEDTVVVEAAGGDGGGGAGGWLTFARVPAAGDDDEDEGGGEGAGGAAAAASGAPIPVTIPGHTPRPAAAAGARSGGGSGKGAAAPSTSAASASAAAAASGSNGGAAGKFDPLAAGRAKKKAPAAAPPSSSSTQQQQQQQEKEDDEPPALESVVLPQQQQQQQQQQQPNGTAAAANGTGGAATAGGAGEQGLDAALASSLLHGGEVPAFLKTPRRRDEQDDAPTCAG